MKTCRRVVVTGLGLVSPFGVGVSHNWQSVLSAKCAVTKLDPQKYANLPCRIGAQVPEGSLPHQFDWSVFSQSERRQMSRAMAFSLTAADEAWTSAKLDDSINRERTGVAFGNGMVDLDDVHNTGTLLDHNKYNKLSPYFVPRILTNMSAGAIGIKYKLQGPNHSVSTACATGAHSIGDAFNFIRYGYADVMLCGGVDACVSPISIAGFSRLRALATNFNDDPQSSSRPFDSKREGFVMGEGAGALVLEHMDHARARNALIYAEIIGYGLAGDGFHMTSPDEHGQGAYLSMSRALQDAQCEAHQIEYVNAHATSTPNGDKVEIAAIERLFGKESVAVSSTKGATGHLLGGAGAVESVFTILAVRDALLPPTINYEKSEFNCPFNVVANNFQKWPTKNDRRIAIKNSFGFGGTNATLCFAQYCES